ncbi:MAG: DNA polymerase III subunit delta [Dehalococcoidales bacterium]|nr:DNA polymerase III subunit delta [Dehalococcoidales bacterium]
MLHVLIGEDDYSIRQALEEIKKTIGDATALMSNTTVLEGKQVTPEQLRSACETVPFLSEKRLVIVEGLLERFGSGNRTGRKKSMKKNGQPEEYKAIADAVKQLPEFTELVILGGAVKSNNPLLRELAAAGKVRTFPRLKQDRLAQWINRRVKDNGGSISQGAVKLLTRFVGNDLWTMANEVDKLVSYAGERQIEEEDIRAVVSYAQEASVFAMVDAVMEFREGVAQGLYQQLLRQGVAPAHLLVMLARQVRIIYQIKELRGQRKTRGDIQSKLGLTNDFVLRKAWDQAERYSPARLREMYHKLLETDVAIKTGKMEDEVALNILIAELGQRGTVSGFQR